MFSSLAPTSLKYEHPSGCLINLGDQQQNARFRFGFHPATWTHTPKYRDSIRANPRSDYGKQGSPAAQNSEEHSHLKGKLDDFKGTPNLERRTLKGPTKIGSHPAFAAVTRVLFPFFGLERCEKPSSTEKMSRLARSSAALPSSGLDFQAVCFCCHSKCCLTDPWGMPQRDGHVMLRLFWRTHKETPINVNQQKCSRPFDVGEPI